MEEYSGGLLSEHQFPEMDKRPVIHLLGHPRNIPDKNREQQARNETVTEKAGIDRDR